MSFLLNALIFLVTLFFTVRFFRRDGRWSWANGRPAFRFFTVLSNVLCALSALGMCLFPGQAWAWTLKYLGTLTVTVTMVTVLLFLGPTMGYGVLFKGSDLFMHLITPLLALVSFCVFERRGMSLGFSLLGLLPVFAYGTFYLYKIKYAPAAKRWDDFYGYNRGGRWPVSYAAMMAGTLLLCLALRFLQNL